MPFPRHTLAEADATVAAAGFQSTSVDAAERCVDCRRMTRRTIVGGAFYCSAPAHVRRAIEVARIVACRVAEVEAIADTAEPAAQSAPIDYTTTPPHALARLARRGDTAAKAEQRWRANRALGMVEPRPATSTPAELDVPPTAEERVTVPIRARELRAGDEVVDSLGARQYAAFDVQLDDPADPVAVKVWTAIRDQEAGLPPVIVVNARRELLVLRPVSEEGRELLAVLDGI